MDSNTACPGVDLNRNYPWKWMTGRYFLRKKSNYSNKYYIFYFILLTGGSSSSSCSEVYAGNYQNKSNKLFSSNFFL